MTAELKEILDTEVDEAIASGDVDRQRRVTARYLKAIGDCNFKTSNRVKSIKETVEDLQNDVTDVKQDIVSLKKTQRQYSNECERRVGAVMLWRFIWAALCAGATVGAFFLGRAMQ